MSKAEDVISSGSRKEIVGVQRKDNKKQENSLLVYARASTSGSGVDQVSNMEDTWSIHDQFEQKPD
jgi:hypothetical protein